MRTSKSCSTSTITMNILLMSLSAKVKPAFRLPDFHGQAFLLMTLRLNRGAFSAWTVSPSALPDLLILTHHMVRTVSIATESTRHADGVHGGLTISSASIFRARKPSTPDLNLQRLLIFRQECDLHLHFQHLPSWQLSSPVPSTVTCPLRPAPVVNQIGTQSWPTLPVPLTVQYLIRRILDRH